MVAAQPGSLIVGTAGIACIAALLIATVALLAKKHRKLVEAFVAERGWTLKSCRYRFALSRRWHTRFDVVVVDQTGHELEGTAWASGVLRGRARIDW